MLRNYIKESLFFIIIPLGTLIQAIPAPESRLLDNFIYVLLGVMLGLLLRTVIMMRRRGSRSILRARLIGELAFGLIQGIWAALLIPADASFYAIVPFFFLLFAFGDILERPDRPFFSTGLFTLLLTFALMTVDDGAGVSCFSPGGSGGCSPVIVYPEGVLLTILIAPVLDPSNRGLPAIIGGAIFLLATYLFGPGFPALAATAIAGVIFFFPGRPVWSYRAWTLYAFIMILSMIIFYTSADELNGSRFTDPFFYRLNVVVGVLLAEVAVHTLVFFTGLYRTVGEQRI